MIYEWKKKDITTQNISSRSWFSGTLAGLVWDRLPLSVDLGVNGWLSTYALLLTGDQFRV